MAKKHQKEDLSDLSDADRPRLFTEFDLPMGSLLGRAIHNFAKITFPILGMIEIKKVNDFPQSGNVGRGLTFRPTTTRGEGTISYEDALTTNVEAWALLSYKVGMQIGEGMAQHFVETMELVTQETGNVVESYGKPLSNDLLLALIESVDFDVDENGEPKGVVLIVSPQMREQISTLPPMTPRQATRFKAIIEKKREAQDAKKRTRTLD